MKYEIIKGSENDFEGESDDTLTVYRIIGSGNTYYSQYPSDKFAIGVDVIAERRPITEPVVNQQLTTEWDGCGLPPVGAECELFDSDDGWRTCFIKFIGTNTAVVDDNGIEFSYELSTCAFRPIRSPKNVSRDEAALDLYLTINSNCTEGDWLVFGIRRNNYYRAIDAGYRKME